jgi:SAM-dependent methyltransferase/uncharacterized protein YbaR (Trm112 family)
MRMSQRQVSALVRCPRTINPLVPTAPDRLMCEDSGQVYPVVNRIPILLDHERSIWRDNDYLPSSRGPHDSPAWEPPRWSAFSQAVLRRISRWAPPTRTPASRIRYESLATHLRASQHDRRPTVLVVGGARIGSGSLALLEAPDIAVVETDIAVGPRTQVVCDAHALPFDEGTFDAVVCQAVLEHVADPVAVATEVRRVLRPRGFVYSEVPFMLQVHGGAYDFTRFTYMGHRRLWRWFDEVDSGLHGGPAMALAWSIQYFLRAFPRRRRARGIMFVVAGGLLSWLPLLDSVLAKRRAAYDAAAGSFFLGRLAKAPISDRELVTLYRGGTRLQPPSKVVQG